MKTLHVTGIHNCGKVNFLSFPSSSLGMHTEITTRKEEDK